MTQTGDIGEMKDFFTNPKYSFVRILIYASIIMAVYFLCLRPAW